MTRRDAGMTLLEVMVIVVIFGILAGSSVPRLLVFLSLQRLSADANRLAQDIHWARSLAAKPRPGITSSSPAGAGASTAKPASPAT